MAGSPEQAPKPSGCGCRPFWDITVFILLAFILWMERDRIGPAVSELRSQIAPIIGTVVGNEMPVAVDTPTPTGVSSPAPIVIMVLGRTATPSRAPTENHTPTPTTTPSPAQSETHTPTPTPVLEPTETYTPDATATPALVFTASPSLTATPTPSPSPTRTSSPTPTDTPSPVPTATSSLTPTSTSSPSPTATASRTPANTSFYLGDFKNGLWLEQQDPNLAGAIKDLSWAVDGVSSAEQKAIQGIIDVAAGSRPLASELLSRRWVREGIDGGEIELIEYFAYLVHEAPDAAARILPMPFLETIEPPDVPAMKSLGMLATYDSRALYDVLDHPMLDAGISNESAPIVATLRGVAQTNPPLVGVLLDPRNVALQTRTVSLPLSGEVVLTIIRTGPGASRSMDLLEHAVRNAEAYMALPLPTNYVGLLYEDAVHGDFVGTNFGTHIAILPEFDVDDGSRRATIAGWAIAHEVAHYYWAGNAEWVDEGAAEFMAAIIESIRTSRPAEVSSPPCAYAGNIAELDSLRIERGDAEFECNYSFGIRLFMDLYLTLGSERFRQGFRELYLASLVEDGADDYRGTSLGIDHVKEAFRSEDGAARVVIARWYHGIEPHDLSRVDRSQADPNLPNVNGRIDEAYLTAGENGPLVSNFSAQGVGDWIILAIEYSYDVSGGSHEVPVEIVEYYQDGFAYRRKAGTLTAKEGYIGGKMWFSVGRAPTERWSPGHYAVFVYAGGQKVAEVYFEVTP